MCGLTENANSPTDGCRMSWCWRPWSFFSQEPCEPVLTNSVGTWECDGFPLRDLNWDVPYTCLYFSGISTYLGSRDSAVARASGTRLLNRVRHGEIWRREVTQKQKQEGEKKTSRGRETVLFSPSRWHAGKCFLLWDTSLPTLSLSLVDSPPFSLSPFSTDPPADSSCLAH